MRFAITGGTGFVGRALQRKLEADGHTVRALSRRSGVDVGDVDALAAALEDCDGVAHCAGINRELHDQRYEQVHVQGTRNVVAAARRAGVPKLVLMSFLRARPSCGAPYHESKWAAEQLVRASGLDYTVIKAGVVFGKGDHMLDHLSHALHTFPLFALVGMRDQRMRPTAVDDVADVLSAALTDRRLSRRTVPVTGPREMSLKEAVSLVGEAIGKRPLFFHLPVRVHHTLAWAFERVMRVPLISIAQVRILSESLVEPAGACDELPADLVPRTPFDADSIARGLPVPGRFGVRDLELSACSR